MSVLIMSSILLPVFQAMTKNDSTAWRCVSVVPATLAFAVGVLMIFYTDDTPRGNFVDIKRTDLSLATRTPYGGLRRAVLNPNAWILAVQYACSFGVEVTMKDAAARYFRDAFGMSLEVSLAIASIFGWLDFFARAMGGVLSDVSHSRWGMRGRLWVQTVALLLEGALILIFAHCYTLPGSIVALVFFSLFVKVAEGSTFGIVPYVLPNDMGSVIGITGAGGSAGAIAFGFVFRAHPGRSGLSWMGGIVLVSSLLSLAISIRGYRGLLWGKDRNVSPETGSIRSKGSIRSGSEVGSVHKS
jgi:MFS transporter, NNP family, nitrate/nitrite transporter